MVEKFILLRASRSVSFAHQVLWNFLSNLDEGREELTMKTVDFLQALTDQGRNAIHNVQNAHLYSNSKHEPDLQNMYTIYKGLTFQHEDPLPEYSLMSKLNYDSRSNLFFSCPTFISNLLSISEYLRTLPLDQRKEKLKEMLGKINTELPNNVYIPIGNFNGHRVLKINLEYCICLHSNEKAPFLILIETENISYASIQSTLIHEVEESKHANEALRQESLGSQESQDDDENASLRLSNESTPIDSLDENDYDNDENRIFQFVDHYAENLVGSNGVVQQLELRTINHKRLEEDKGSSDSRISNSTASSLQSNQHSRHSDHFEYQLARVSKRKPSLWKKVL